MGEEKRGRWGRGLAMCCSNFNAVIPNRSNSHEVPKMADSKMAASSQDLRGGSSTGPDRNVGPDVGMNMICLNVGLSDVSMSGSRIDGCEEQLAQLFEGFWMLLPDLIMLQEVNDFWLPKVEAHVKTRWPEYKLKYDTYNKTLTILIGPSWDPDSIVGGEVSCFGRTSDQKKELRKFYTVDATWRDADVSLMNAHTASSEEQKIPGKKTGQRNCRPSCQRGQANP